MKVKVEYQYFEDCPNHSKMQKNPYDALIGIEDKVKLTEIVINSNELANELKFRGSPTLLINGKDLYNMIEPLNPSLSCRVYKNGVPNAETIKNRILEEINKITDKYRKKI
jgi:protein-disulfide isomerase